MRLIRLRSCSPLLLLLLALACCTGHAQDNSGGAAVAGALDLLFELGLPDTKSAKWVQAQGSMTTGQLFDEDGFGPGAEEAGNAWAIDEKGGVVTLLMVDGTRVKAIAAKDGSDAPGDGDLPPAIVKPADWNKDAAAFLARLKKIVEKSKGSDDENDYRLRTRHSAGRPCCSWRMRIAAEMPGPPARDCRSCSRSPADRIRPWIARLIRLRINTCKSSRKIGSEGSMQMPMLRPSIQWSAVLAWLEGAGRCAAARAPPAEVATFALAGCGHQKRGGSLAKA